MADNTQLPATGTGTADIIVATDKIGGVDYQRIKLSVGDDGSAADVKSGGGTEAGSLRVTVASDSTGVLSVDDNGASLTVDGTVAVTNGGTFAVQDSAAEASLSVMDDWDESDRAKVNPIAGQAGVQGGSGVVTALTQRVVLATDVALPAGTNAIGKLSANSGVDIGDVDVTSISAGTNLIGNTGHKQVRIGVTPTVSTSPAYTAKDAVGGIMEFANAVGVSGGTGILMGVTVYDLAQQMQPMDLLLFDQTMAGTFTDNSALDPTDGDLANLIAIVPISAWADFNDNSAAYRGGLGIPFKANATSIFGALVARGTPTFAGTSDIKVTIDVIQNA